MNAILPRPTETCPDCYGEGYVLPNEFAVSRLCCETCGGEGQVPAVHCELCGEPAYAVVEIDQGGVAVCAACDTEACDCETCLPTWTARIPRDTMVDGLAPNFDSCGIDHAC